MSDVDLTIANYELKRISSMLAEAVSLPPGKSRTFLLIGAEVTLRWVIREAYNVADRPPSLETTIDVHQLQSDKKILQALLRELALVTEHLLLSGCGQEMDRLVVQKAVIDAEGLLGDLKPRYVNDGPLTLAEMVRALRNIHFDLTCDRCAAIFYTGKADVPHSTECTTDKERHEEQDRID